jgi:hypothetical protein
MDTAPVADRPSAVASALPVVRPPCCTSPELVQPVARRLLTAEFADTRVLSRVDEYCDRCRTITPSSFGAGKVTTDDAVRDRQLRRSPEIIRMRLAQREALAKSLPWADVVTLLELPSVSGSQLYSDWSIPKLRRDIIEVHRMRQLGIPKGRRGVRVRTPVPEIDVVNVDGRLVYHPFLNASRWDADHMRYGGPLTISSLRDPDEVNIMPERTAGTYGAGRPESYAFLKAFTHGDRIATVLVAVHREKRFAITSYRLETAESENRVDAERRLGVTIHTRLPH